MTAIAQPRPDARRRLRVGWNPVGAGTWEQSGEQKSFSTTLTGYPGYSTTFSSSLCQENILEACASFSELDLTYGNCVEKRRSKGNIEHRSLEIN